MKKSYTLKLEGKEWKDCLHGAYNKKKKDIKMDGFRKGQVPYEIYIKKVGIESLYMDSIDMAVDILYAKLLSDKDTITSLPTSSILSSSLIRQCIKPLVDYIIMKINDVILNLSSELTSDLVTNGIVLTGGSALLNGLKDYMAETLQIPVRIPQNPEDSVITGLSLYIEQLIK